MGVELFIHRKHKNGVVESIEVPRSAKIYSWIINNLGKKKSPYWVEGKIGQKEYEKILAAWIAGRFIYTVNEPNFQWELSCYIGVNYPEIIEKFESGELKNIPEEIIREFLEKEREFQGNEAKRVVEFIREGLEKNCKITFSAA